MSVPILSITILVPVLSALCIALFVRGKYADLYSRYIGVIANIIVCVLSIYLVSSFDNTTGDYQFTEFYAWPNIIGLHLDFAVDSIAVLFILLTAILSLLSVVSSLRSVNSHVKEFVIYFLILEALTIGVFSTKNLLLFFFFFEATLIPMYLIIGIWGGENRLYASTKFFLYTLCGSVLFLASLVYIFVELGTFDMKELCILMPYLSPQIQYYLWIAIFIGFAIKVPMCPFHTWLPDAHVQAPTFGSIILAGILLKIGAYGLIRVSLPMLPYASAKFSAIILFMSAIAVLYGSYVAMAQSDMKKAIAYSSVAHMGYVTGGLFSYTSDGVNGAIFQMISHGLVSGGLFMIVGMLYNRLHTKEIMQYGGVASKMPLLAACFMIMTLASVGLPGTSGFVGEFLSLLAVAKSDMLVMIIMGSGMIYGAIYMLRLYRNVMLGKIVNNKIQHFAGMQLEEIFGIVPLVIMVIYIGIYPNAILSFIDKDVGNFIHDITRVYYFE